MKSFRFFLVALVCAIATSFAQQITVTPQLGLQLPGYGSSNWHVPLNYDMSLLDKLLSGQLPIPGLNVNGAVTTISATLKNTGATNGVVTSPFVVMNGSDATLGPLSVSIIANPSATAASRWAGLSVGDNLTTRPLVLNTDGLGHFGRTLIGTTTDDGSTALQVSGAAAIGSTLSLYSGNINGAVTVPSLRGSLTGNASLSGTGTGGVFLSYDYGSGGVNFGNGQSGVVAKIDSTGSAAIQGLSTRVRTVSAADTASISDATIVATTAAAFTETLPAAPASGQELFIVNAGANTLTIAGNGHNVWTTGGASTASASLFANASTILQYDGSLWRQLTGGATIQTSHIGGAGATPTFACGAVAGTCTGVSIAGNDQSGGIQFTTGTTAPSSGGTIAAVTFAAAYPSAAHCTVSPANPFAGTNANSMYVLSGTSGLSLLSTAGGLPSNTAYSFNYVCGF